MGQDSKIEWTRHTFNPWRGCTKVSAGCAHCYAETLSGRNPKVLGRWGPQGTRVVASEAAWREPLKWDRAAAAAGERHRVFCASLADVFEDWGGPMENAQGVQVWKRDDGSWATSDHYRDTVMLTMGDARHRLFQLIHATPRLDWLLLTKRPENVGRILNQLGIPGWWEWVADSSKNVWMGVSVEHQATADERIPRLLEIPAAVRFLSVEPLLGPVDLSNYLKRPGVPCPDGIPGCEVLHLGPQQIHWVIVGGESGPHARPMHPAWAQSIRDQCQAAGVPFFFKQWGEFLPGPQVGSTYTDDELGRYLLRRIETPAGGLKQVCYVYRTGKKVAGRLLDGREWSEFPEESP